MKPIPQDLLEKVLTPIGELRRAESAMNARTNIQYSIQQVSEGYDMRTTSAFVDDLDAPKSCLIVRLGKSWLEPGTVCVVLGLWVAAEVRSTPAALPLVNDAFKTIEAFAALNECSSISGSSWVYLGSPDMDAMWARHGFDLQEKVFVRTLTSD